MYNKIAWFDLETTGKDPEKDKAVQVAVLITDLDFNILTGPITTLINPEIPIDPKSTEVHGITDNDVLTAPKFLDISNGLFNLLNDCHFAGYNVLFDIKFLASEFFKVGLNLNVDNKKIIDPLSVLRKMEPRDQSSVYKYYTGKDLDGAHDAQADILATFEIAKCQIEKYSEINSIEDMHLCSDPEKRCDLAGKIIKNEDNVYVFNFGKHYSNPIETELGYLRWMQAQDFPQNTKDWIEKYFNNIENG